MAKNAVELQDAWYTHGTLAAAYAELGEFDKAVAEQDKKLEFKTLDAKEREEGIKQLSLYKAKKPYRQE